MRQSDDSKHGNLGCFQRKKLLLIFIFFSRWVLCSFSSNSGSPSPSFCSLLPIFSPSGFPSQVLSFTPPLVSFPIISHLLSHPCFHLSLHLSGPLSWFAAYKLIILPDRELRMFLHQGSHWRYHTHAVSPQHHCCCFGSQATALFPFKHLAHRHIILCVWILFLFRNFTFKATFEFIYSSLYLEASSYVHDLGLIQFA